MNPGAPSSASKPRETVGVLLVHGIGEQRRYQHLESEVRKIVAAIIAEYGTPRRNVTVTLETGSGDELFGAQMSWVSGRKAPLHALVDMPDKIVDVAFHEVWWADINEALTLGKQFRFWLWGLCLPGAAPNQGQYLPGGKSTMRPPANSDRVSLWDRFRIFFVSAFIFLSGFTLSLLNVILRRLKFNPAFTTATIVNYLSGVKLYNQTTRSGGGPMDGPDEPPRAAIRRRMIRAMVDVATVGYSRWYVLAHSLGTVVAWNGLMEPHYALANYLDESRWKDLVDQSNAEPDPAKRLVKKDPSRFDVEKMMPQRPLWLDKSDMIDRTLLFANFRGVLTYGSPLERFCALWSNMVLINSDESVFPGRAEWVNVYDPTDPVASWLVNFNPDDSTPVAVGFGFLKPANFACRASDVLLLSHLRYLENSDDPRVAGHRLVRQIARWLVGDESLKQSIAAAPRNEESFWMPLPTPQDLAKAVDAGPVRRRRFARYVQWVSLGVIFITLTAIFLLVIFGKAVAGFLLTIAAAAFAVFAAFFAYRLIYLLVNPPSLPSEHPAP